MKTNFVDRREFLTTFLGGLSFAALDWSSFPINSKTLNNENEFDAIIIGSGLGGLSCGAAFARQGFKPLIIEQHDKPGGYATTFARPGGFVFDTSLHSTSVGERNGLHNLISGFPEITDVEFVPHPNLYRAIFPDYDIRVPQKDIAGYTELLVKHFPEEQEGIKGIIEDMRGLSKDIGRLSNSRGQVDMTNFPQDFPYLFKCAGKTWGQMVDARIKNQKLKAIVSVLWGYYGLPPSKLSAYYYALPTIGYLEQGGYYPIGKSQKISNALVKFIEDKGGKVLLKTKVAEILTKDNSAYGVRSEDGKEFLGKVIVSNASAYDTFNSMMKEKESIKEYLTKMENLSVSLSCFQVFLGLKEDLVGKLGIKDSEIFYETGYDQDYSYNSALNAFLPNNGYSLTLYDNIYKGYSPEGKNTVTIMVLQGYEHWKEFETDYFKGKKEAYRAEKEKLAAHLIQTVETTLLKGLHNSIEVMEIGTPLTNLHYTGNYRGAIYGWDQTVNNSGPSRFPHNTPIKNLYLAGAWTKPGHGYGGVLWSGLECFNEIMKKW